MKQASIVLMGAIFLATCGAEQAEESESVRVSQLPRPEQPSSNGFADPNGGIAIVSGTEAASIDIRLPARIDDIDPELAALIRARAEEGKDAFLAAAQNDRVDAENKGYAFRPHSLTVSWEEVGPREGTLRSFLGSYAAYAGGAHPNFDYGMLNWDEGLGEAIGFGDLFQDDEAARAIMADALQTALIAAKRERMNDDSLSDEQLMDNWLRAAFENNDVIFENFTIARGIDSEAPAGLIYHFEPYTVGAYAEGPYEVGVPASVFIDELAPRYGDLFDADAEMVDTSAAP
ncbi:MAG TPA: DUF3298/DUF4163 domain-containing protein [Henriciella marina]|uniref:DUF3298 and DUF4163 domain-containing protein n=1 Tax=Henriciella sp. TaxID=1968823 RepID=UPI0017D6F1B2|nr:DUF3298 and DUF4163 domain-containing protein [Henriciella sp.]HIG24013.1 DUF3298/DUF4163 domain-containing protein [Henriciella sp.]HIK63410.1 DUF3298/DUF4163 domain-containing protein [Henriciella marina]